MPNFSSIRSSKSFDDYCSIKIKMYGVSFLFVLFLDDVGMPKVFDAIRLIPRQCPINPHKCTFGKFVAVSYKIHG